MATTSLNNLKDKLAEALFNFLNGKNPDAGIVLSDIKEVTDVIADEIDTYIVEVVSKVTGTTVVSTTVAPGIPVTVVGSAGSTVGPGTGTGSGTVSVGNLTTN